MIKTLVPFDLQTSDLDTLLCRQDLERLQRLDVEKQPNGGGSMDEFEFVECRAPQANFVSGSSSSSSTSGGTRTSGNGTASHHPDDDVFLRPPLWEDITSSIQKLDPENADMLGQSQTSSHVCIFFFFSFIV